MQLLAAYLILLVHVMDTSIANVALLSVTTDLMIDAYDGHWVVTAFGIGMASAMPFVPRVVDWLGASTTLTFALALSICSIALCAVTDSFALLILSRFLQGATSGAVALMMQKLMMNYVGQDRRAYALALWTSAITIAPVFGPFIGALVISVLNWRWLFLGQIPILLAAALLIHGEFTLRVAPGGKAPRLASMACLGGAVLCLEMGLEQVLSVEHADHLRVLPWAAGGGLLLLLGRWVSQRRHSTLFDWSLLRDGRYVGYMSSSALIGAITLSTSVVYTIWLQVVLDLGVLDVAKVLAAGSLIAGGLTVLIGKIKYKHIFPYLVASGLVCQIVSFWLVTRLTTEVSMADLALPRIIAGFGSALCSPLGFLSVAELATTRVLAANSLGMFVRTMCGNVLVLLGAEGLRWLERLLRELALADGFGERYDGAMDLVTGRQLEGVLGALSATGAMHVVYSVAIGVQCLLLVHVIRLGLQRRAPLAPLAQP